MGNSRSAAAAPAPPPSMVTIEEGIDAPADESTGLVASSAAGAPSEEKGIILSITFHLETLRMIAFINFDIVMVLCSVLTKTFVTIPTDQTVIYKIFGFNHACNVLDHHPAREVGAILLIFFILPMASFLFLSHYRTKRAFQMGQVPAWLLTYSTVTTPFNFLATSWCYMWFVNSPEDTYGFIAHYIPYLAFQIMMALVAFHQVFYLIYKNSLPWGIPSWAAVAYAIFLTVLTIVYTIFVVSILVGQPVWDSVHNDADRIFAEVIAKLYSVCVLILPVLFSYKHRQNGEYHTISFE
jgi:hypothetical protein